MNRFYRNLNDQDKKEFILGFVTIILLLVPLVFLSLFAFTIPILTTESVDICDCLTNASYYNNNENDCDKAINKELGHNWKTTNYSQEPSKSAKFDALAERCN